MSRSPIAAYPLRAGGHAKPEEGICIMDPRWRALFGSRTVEIPGGCWEWQGYRQPNGYGSLRRKGFASAIVHRQSLIVASGGDQPGLDARHLCDNRACIRPSHLAWGTRSENMYDCTRSGRHNKPTGEAHWCAKLTDADVIELRRLRSEGWTVTALGERFHIHNSYVSRVARGLFR